MSIDDKEDAVDLWQQGYDTLQIAEYFRVSEGFIWGALPQWRTAFTALAS